jgi:hypothetical protein
MDAVMTTIDVSANSSAIRAEHLAWAEERLGPKPGKWDGYEGLSDDETRRDLWSKVGYIHGMSAEAGRNIVAIGQTLLEMKEMLPHGQFMACVKAEFGWSQPWAYQLMQVAERFANHKSTYDLPSSAQVLALLARSGADDATVQQAADEGWTVAETKRRVAKPRGPREPQPTEALALNLIRKGELDRIREALALAERAKVVTGYQVMAEQRLRELPKGSRILGADADFHRLKDGSWVRMPHAGRVDIDPEARPAPEPDPEPTQQPAPELTANIDSELLTTENAANKLGVNVQRLRQGLTPGDMAKRNGKLFTVNGYTVVKAGRGFVRITPITR